MASFARQLLFELHKLVVRKRTHLGCAMFVAVEILLLLLFKIAEVRWAFSHVIELQGHAPDHYFSGLTLALLVLRTTAILLGALYIATVASDLVATEIEDGTMRMLFCRPVSRLRVLAIKFASASVFTFALTLFLGLSALLAGFAFYGSGGLFVFGPQEKIFSVHEFWPGLVRYFSILPLLALSLSSVHSMAFMFSCFDMKPTAAVVATLSIFFADLVFRNLPFLESLAPWFITARMGGCGSLRRRSPARAWWRITPSCSRWTPHFSSSAGSALTTATSKREQNSQADPRLTPG